MDKSWDKSKINGINIVNTNEIVIYFGKKRLNVPQPLRMQMSQSVCVCVCVCFSVYIRGCHV